MPQQTPKEKRVYPRVSEVQDWRAGDSLRLLWDRTYALEERIKSLETMQTSILSDLDAAQTDIETASRQAREAIALSQQPGQPGGAPIDGGGGGDLPGGGDGGAGAIGCAAAGATGHDSGGLLNGIRAGQIVCGTGNEFPALRNPTATINERDANAEELMLRAVWHLRTAGFLAGRQQNPSGILSRDKLTIEIDGVVRAYDIFLGKGNFAVQMQTQMLEVGPPVMIDDPGIPD